MNKTNLAVFFFFFAIKFLMAEFLLHRVVRQAKEEAAVEGMIHEAKVV